jgi:large subunit ribosomal protein L5
MVSNTATANRPRLQALFQDSVAAKAMEQFGLRNRNELPRVVKVVINCGVGRFLENQKLKPEIRETVMSTLSTISGQRPVMIATRRAVANFKVREGAPSAFMVTLRRERMWNFLDRLINLAVPRIKDFRGLPKDAFDTGGSYSLGLTEQAVWPEINMANVVFNHGMNINIVFDRSTPEMSRFILAELGLPFTREDDRDPRRAR